eukprot:1876920-Prymnesium_polylepis.1
MAAITALELFSFVEYMLIAFVLLLLPRFACSTSATCGDQMSLPLTPSTLKRLQRLLYYFDTPALAPCSATIANFHCAAASMSSWRSTTNKRKRTA